MRLFSYIVRVDSGFAPNPFFGYCTLACCKPVIRCHARESDWVVGLTPKKLGNRLLYAMKLTEPSLTFDQYYRDKRFRSKRPQMNSRKTIFRRGDNIYKPEEGGFKQLWSQHSEPDGSERTTQKNKDLGGRHILVSDHFYYFGRSAKPLPASLSSLIVGRAHKCNFPRETIKKFEKYIARFERGVLDCPHIWPDDDQSFEETDEAVCC